MSSAQSEFRETHVTHIRPVGRWPRLDLHELWRFRELLGIFIWRDLKVRYKQTYIGAAWAIFQPLITAAVYIVIFGKFANFQKSAGVESYQVFVYTATLPMLYFTSAVSASSMSVVGNVSMVTKVFFPRVLLPLSTVVTPLVDLALAMVVLIPLMIHYDERPGSAIVTAPLFLGLALITALGIGLTLSALNVRYRDVPYVIPTFLQLMPLLSGVMYAFESLPEKWQWILSLNPMTLVVSGWRWALLGAPAPQLDKAIPSLIVAALLLLSGIAFFRSSEPKFADNI